MKTLFLALALFLVPAAVRADSVNFNLGNGTWVWSMPQGAVPDQGSVAAGDFTFLQVSVFTTISGLTQTFDLHFFTEPGFRDFILACDPFEINLSEPQKTCDYFERVEIAGTSGMWSGTDTVQFVPGSYRGLLISTPELPALALLLLAFICAGFFCWKGSGLNRYWLP